MARAGVPEGWTAPDKSAGRSRDEVTSRLEDWMRTRLETASDLVVSDVSWPVGAGVSNETILFTASWDEGGRVRSRDLVLRISPGAFQLFMDPGFELQFRLLDVLHRQRLAKVAEPLWYEEDRAYFGQAFFVMSRLNGRVPVSYPPYNATGWLFDAEPRERERLWRNAMHALARIHRVPPQAVTFLDKPALGATGFDQLFRYWRDSYDWAREGRDYPAVQAALDWLAANRPAAPASGLSWGDARIGNMMFDDAFDVTGVMDWEQVSLGGAMQDVGWWTYFDILHSTSMSLARLEGLGSLEDTVALWEDLTGRAATDLRWHQVFAGLKLAVIVMKRLHITGDLKPGYNANNNIWTRLTAELHGGPAPADILQR